LAASPDVLARQAAATRADIDQKWRVIRAQVPEPPVWRTKPGDAAAPERPSWLQIAVAALALAVLPMSKRREAAASWRVARDEQRLAPTEAAAPRPTQPVPAE
jgi:hypothetical protein